MITQRYVEEFGSLHKACNDLLSLIATEKQADGSIGRDFKGEEKTQQEARFKRMDQIKALSEQEVKLAGYQFAQKQNETELAVAAGFPGSAAAAAAISGAGGASGKSFKSHDEFMSALREGDAKAVKIGKDVINHFLRTGRIPEEYKFTLISTSDSSIMLPQEVAAPYIVRRNVNSFRKALSFYGYPSLKTTTSDQIKLPVWDDTSNIGQVLSENSTSNDTADSTLTGSVTLNNTLFESKCKWFSNTLINAEGFDILSYVLPILQIMLDKAQESTFTTTATTNLTTNLYTVTASQVGVTYKDLLNWEHSIIEAYRRDAVFILADTLYKAFRGMVDSNNRPIIDLNPAGQLAQGSGQLFIEQIHGKPIAVNDYLTALTNSVAAAGTEKCGIFISADGIKLRDVVPQRATRYVNIPTFPDQTGYNLFANGDCQFVNNAGSVFLY